MKGATKWVGFIRDQLNLESVIDTTIRFSSLSLCSWGSLTFSYATIILYILNAKPTERAIVNAIKSLQNLYNNAELEHFDYSLHLCRYSAQYWVQWGSEKVSPVLNIGEPLWDLFVSSINKLPGLDFFIKQIFVLKFLIYVVYLFQMNVHVVFHNKVILVKSALLWMDIVCIHISRFQLSKNALSVNNIELV